MESSAYTTAALAPAFRPAIATLTIAGVGLAVAAGLGLLGGGRRKTSATAGTDDTPAERDVGVPDPAEGELHVPVVNPT